MSQLNDLKLAFFIANGPAIAGAHINDAARAYYVQEVGVSVGSIQDLELAFYKQEVAGLPTETALMDAKMAYFEQETGLTGQINDLEFAHYGGGGGGAVIFEDNYIGTPAATLLGEEPDTNNTGNIYVDYGGSAVSTYGVGTMLAGTIMLEVDETEYKLTCSCIAYSANGAYNQINLLSNPATTSGGSNAGARILQYNDTGVTRFFENRSGSPTIVASIPGGASEIDWTLDFVIESAATELRLIDSFGTTKMSATMTESPVHKGVAPAAGDNAKALNFTRVEAL